MTEANNARLSSQDGCDADDCHDDDDDDECAPNGGLDNEEDDQEDDHEDDQEPVMGGNTATASDIDLGDEVVEDVCNDGGW